MRINNLRLLLIFFLFIFIILAVGKYFVDIVQKEKKRAEIPTGPVISTEKQISWEEIVEKVKSCNVQQVLQTHDLKVAVVMDDGTVYSGIEPAIDEILKLAEEASHECDESIIRVTE